MTICEKTGIDEQSDKLLLGSLYINPTRYCNLCCKHCWVSPPYKEELEESGEELPIEGIIGIIKEAKKIGTNHIKLTGGEPLMRKDLGILMEYCNSSDVRVTLETNGTLITKDIARMLRRFKMGHISISIDSASEEIHDFWRGKKGAFRRAIEGIKNLKEENIHVQVIMTLYKESLKNFYCFLDLMKELNVSDIKINVICPVGRGADLHKTSDVPTVREILKFSEKLQEMRESSNFKGTIFLDIPMAFRRIEEVKSRGSRTCAIKNILGILSDGSVSICGIGFVDERLLFGNVRDDPSILKDIWYNHPVLKEIREDIPSKLEGVCGICVLKNRCLGSCRAMAHYGSGSLTAPFWFCQEAYDMGLFPSTRVVPEELRV